MNIEVLGPVPENIDGDLVLRWFDPVGKNGGIGKTKNVHSVVLVVNIVKMRILMGGDLNSLSADYLMTQYSGIDIEALRAELDKAKDGDRAPLEKQMENLINEVRKEWKVDIAKACHHGSS